MRVTSPGQRRLAIVTIAANLVWVTGWLVAAGWQGPGYSVVRDSISDMMADGAPAAGVLIVIFALSGAVIIVFALGALWPALRPAGPRARGPRSAA